MPVELFAQLIDLFATPGDVVLDPFAGSGPAMRAAQTLGLSSISVELDYDRAKALVAAAKEWV